MKQQKADNQYIIPVAALKVGEHRFDFLIDTAFLEGLNYSEIKRGEVKVGIVLEKTVYNMQLLINLSGWVELHCDRCLKALKKIVDAEHELLVNFRENPEESDSEDIINLPFSIASLDLAQTLYEYVAIEKPLKVNCEDFEGNSCDPEIDQFLAKEENTKATEDPRWAALKRIKFD